MRKSTETRDPAGRRGFGERMERAAWDWLEGRHARERRLLGRNVTWRGGELDLVFEERDPGRDRVTLVFAEVRARGHGRLRPIETLTRSKRTRLRTTAARFLARYAGPARAVRFDLLGWTPGGGWEWWPAVFGAED